MTTDTGVTQEQLLNATSPEALAALMVQANERMTDSPPEGVTETEQAQAVDAAATQVQAPASATPGAESSEEPHGVATKSGKHVLPYSVLQEARTDAQSARQRAETAEREAEELRRKVAELTAGGTQTQQAAAMANELSDEEISAAEYDAPLVAKLARQIKALQAAQTAAPAAPAEQDTQDAQDDQRAQVHAALSQRPFLTQLQSAGGIRWARACEIDAELRNNPGYANRGDPVARFADVEARIAAELGVQVMAAPAPTPPPAPAPKAPEIQPFRPNTASDLMGGATPTGSDNGINEAADGMAMARRFGQMTDAQMDAAIRRSA